MNNDALAQAEREHCSLTQGYPNAEYLTALNVIDTKLTALGIIKSKRVDVDWLLESETVSQYNKIVVNPNCELEPEEFELLRRVLG